MLNGADDGLEKFEEKVKTHYDKIKIAMHANDDS